MGRNDSDRTPRHGTSRGSGDRRASAGSRRNTAGDTSQRLWREELRDNYYYEEPPKGWKEGDQFQDISSYSSPAKRRADQRAVEEEVEKTRRGASRRSSRDISSGRPVKKKGSAAKKVLVTLLVLLVLVGGGFFYVFGYLLSGMTMTSLTSDPDALGISSSAYSDSQVVNVALFGLDARNEGESSRSDVVMVLTVDKRHHTLKLTSILRDSEVQIDGYGADKITHAYAYGGPELAVRTINQNFNLDIKNYVSVDFHQMADIVDAFGGVDMELTAAEADAINENLWTLEQESPGTVTYADYIPSLDGTVQLVYGEYQDGTYHLNGNRAVAYSRIRYLDSDDVRASRQQKVMMALVEQLKKKSVFEYPGLIRKISAMCETSLDVGDLLGMAPIMLGGLQMETLSIPGEEEQAYGAYLDNGAWVYEYDLTAASQHISRFIYEENSPYYTGS